jgi:excisionase family DNA binding protein
MHATFKDEKLDVLETGTLLGVSPHTVRAWIRQRKIPFYRCGRRIVLSRTDLEQFLEAHRVSATEPSPE